MVRIKKIDYEFFQISQCQRCSRYQINHDPSVVFHGIDSRNLKYFTNGTLVPKGKYPTPYYQQIFRRRYLHLGPLSICGLLDDNSNSTYFSFKVNELKRKHPKIKFIDHVIWEHLGFHFAALPPEERKRFMKDLFLQDYSLEVLTEILTQKLDCNTTLSVIGKSQSSIENAKKFLTIQVPTILLRGYQEITQRYSESRHSRKHLDCACGFKD